jgi:hypothetical protein
MSTGEFSITAALWSFVVGGLFNIPTIPYKKLKK